MEEYVLLKNWSWVPRQTAEYGKLWIPLSLKNEKFSAVAPPTAKFKPFTKSSALIPSPATATFRYGCTSGSPNDVAAQNTKLKTSYYLESGNRTKLENRNLADEK